MEIAARRWLPADSREVSQAPTLALLRGVMSSASPHPAPKSRGTGWEEASANEDLKKQRLFRDLEEGGGRDGNRIYVF